MSYNNTYIHYLTYQSYLSSTYSSSIKIDSYGEPCDENYNSSSFSSNSSTSFHYLNLQQRLNDSYINLQQKCKNQQAIQLFTMDTSSFFTTDIASTNNSMSTSHVARNVRNEHSDSSYHHHHQNKSRFSSSSSSSSSGRLYKVVVVLL
jgi:hypothetical protein